MTANIVEGNLFDSDAQYIVHQCNCITWASAHLAGEVFRHYPWSDIYTQRKGTDYRDTPGEIIIRGNGKDQRYVIAVLGQYYPGKPRYPNSKLDGAEARKGYFFSGLKKIIEIPGLKSIAFPWGIGCGAAGGDWNFYHELIKKFAAAIPTVDVRIYHLK
jgi:O-acetyl-ADP-ribose deacetylase (regulator of RNase III)